MQRYLLANYWGEGIGLIKKSATNANIRGEAEWLLSVCGWRVTKRTTMIMFIKILASRYPVAFQRTSTRKKSSVLLNYLKLVI